MPKITEVRKLEKYTVYIKHGPDSLLHEYERHGANDWFVWVKGTLEPVYDTAELEAVFLDYVRAQGVKVGEGMVEWKQW